VRQLLDKARREGLLTTIEAAFNRLDQPMPLGYSSAGEVIAVGEGLDEVRVGQRVACAGGGYAVHAELACVPRNLLAPLPDEVSYESAAFATLGAIAMHGFRLGEIQVGERVAVIGLGLLGLLATGIARAAGCRVLGVDLDPRRVELGRLMGGDAVLRPRAEEAAAVFSQGRGCDAILICADTSASDPVELAGAIARDRARVVAVGAVGLHLPRKTYFEKELFFVNSRSYGPGRYDPAYEEGGQDYPIGFVRWTEGRNLEAFIDLLAQAQLDVQPLISHRFNIQEAPAAYELITGKRKEPFLGILLTYPQPEPGEAAAPAPAPAAASRPPQGAISLGVLGAGNFATAVMLPAVKKIPGIHLECIASAAGLHAAHAQRKFGFRRAVGDENELLGDAAINTVAVLTRHHLHARQVVAALQAGKHVFCEKPLALNAAELDEVATALQAAQESTPERAPLLTVGFNRRFAPLAQRLMSFLDTRQEPLAAVYRINAGYIPEKHWVHDPLQGGGRLVGEGCHFVDFLTFLVGAPPQRVATQALPDLGRYREDNFSLTLTFPDGSLGVVMYLANGDKSFGKERVEVLCGGRVAVLDDFRSLELVQDGRRQVAQSRLRQEKGHGAIWQAFSSAIQIGGQPPIPYQQIFGVHRAVFAALESLRTSRAIDLTS
jgi:predicted dehydrogenase/threonine dehydrogenase-like Zn-dependent dehydrogenase